MRFGAVPVAEAKGGIVAHAIRKGALVLKKGTVVGDAELAALRAAGVAKITVARLDPGDVPEDVAAAELAAAIGGDGVRVARAFTGRANLFADAAGLLVVDGARVNAFNAVDPDITLATLTSFAPVLPGTMIATVKVIPFAISGQARDSALSVARAGTPLVRIAPYRLRKIGVISTLLPGLAEKVIDKTVKVTTARLAPADAAIIAEKRIRTSRRRSHPRCAKFWMPARRWRSYSALPQSPTAAMSFPRRSKRSAGGWSTSACRSIPAI